MAYIPNPDTATAPLDTEFASSAAAEFRALKAKVNSFFLASDYSADSTSNLTQKGLTIFNIGGTDTGLLYGVLGLSNRTTASATTLGGYFSASIADSITTTGGSFVAGILIEANTSVVDSVANTLFGAQIYAIQRNNSGQDFVIGVTVNFADRDASLVAGSVVGGVGDDLYNHNSVGLMIRSQVRSTAGEKCGWLAGIRFEDFSLDEDDVTSTPQAIDFTGISQTSAASSVAFHFNSASLSTHVATNAGAIVLPTHFDKWLPVMVDGVVALGIPLCSIV